jgi:hypothetical protein
MRRHLPLPLRPQGLHSRMEDRFRTGVTLLLGTLLFVVPAAAAGTVCFSSLPSPAWTDPGPGLNAPTPEREVHEGLFDVEVEGERIRFVVPDSLLGRDMAVLSRVARAQAGLMPRAGGDRLTPNMTVRWERRGDRIMLRAMSHEMRADEGTPEALAVANSSFPPILASLEVEERRGAASVIDVSELYMADHPAFSMPPDQRTRFGVRAYDRDRSYLEWVRSFPKNVEIPVVRSYHAERPPVKEVNTEERIHGSLVRGRTISYEVNHSMVLLPEEPMRPRYHDPRTGYLHSWQLDFSSDYQGIRPRAMIRRYRLEPADTAAFLRGELSDPVRPWVWYIDPATPEWVRPYVKEGILEWNEGFEQAGFRNAVEVRMAPTEEEDPEFSLLDARYSVVRWVATTERSANAGGDVIDPRSGEVIRAHMNWYHAMEERERWWNVSQMAGWNPDMQRSRLSDRDMGEAVRATISHEKAHAVGLYHNQRANWVFPVDSLRSAAFVREWGHSASTVGRTRRNYIAQPGDDVPAERRIGEWDKFAVMWGYRPVIGAESADEEWEVIHEWVVEHADRPWFRFALPQFGMDVEWDPFRMTEGLGADPVRAAEYGMANLRRVAENLLDWVVEEGDDYYELENFYLQLLTQWNRYAEHAAAHVGGSETHHKRFGEEGWVYTPIDRESQLRAMAFLDEHVLATPWWALDLDVLRRLEHAGAVERIRAYQELAVQRLLNHARLARLIEHEAFFGDESYRPAEMLDDVRAMVWREVLAGEETNTYRRTMQRAYLDQAHHLLHEAEVETFRPPPSGNLRVSDMNDPPLNAPLHVGQSDIRPLLRDQLYLLREELEAALDAAPDRNTRIHIRDALERIDRALWAR